MIEFKLSLQVDQSIHIVAKWLNLMSSFSLIKLANMIGINCSYESSSSKFNSKQNKVQ